MKYTRIFLLFAVLVFWGAAACSQRDAELQLPAAQPDIRGIITEVERTSDGLHIMVEENPADSAGSAKASVRVGEQAEIMMRNASELREAGAGELARGMRVSVWYDGPVLLSYPARAGAKTVVVEK